MNVITYSCGHLLYSDESTVMSRLNKRFGFGHVVSVESNLNMERFGDVWKEDNLTLVNYHKEVKFFRLGDCGLVDMPPISRELLEKLSLDRCHLYNMHRDETLTFRELDKQIQDCFQYWNYVLDKFSIDLFICHGFPHAFQTYSLYAICKARGIKVLYLGRSCVLGYIYITDDVFANFERLETAYKDALAEGGSYTFSKYMQKSVIEPLEKDQYKWIFGEKEKGYITTKPESLRERVARVFSALCQLNRWGEYIKRYYRKHEMKSIPKKTDRYYRRISKPADYSKRYIYVPLHMQPESTTSPMGNVFVDQYYMINMLSHAVRGTDILLYVKEHGDQTMFLRRSRRKLYDELAAIPNVRLVSLSESSSKLQNHSVITATITGTVTMELLFKFKPVLVFGNVINNLSPNALVVSDVESCKAALSEVIEGRFSIGLRERDAFLYALEKACVRGCWFVRFSDLFDISQDEAAENVYREFERLIEEMGLQ